MVLQNLVRALIAVGEGLGRAFARAVRDEIRANREAAARHATSSGGREESATRESANANSRLGITLQESLQILNVKEPLDRERVRENFERLFAINDKSKGGSLYLQSKIFRAKERIDQEIGSDGKETSTQEADGQGKENRQEQGRETRSGT